MAKLNPNSLPELTKSMFLGQQKWSASNWDDTLKKHSRDVEKLLNKIKIFDLWKEILETKYGGVSNELIPEIIMDAYISVHFACMGLYKQANVCLRAQLETALRLVHFSTHSIEFKWWRDGSVDLGGQEWWGKGYDYFCRLEEIKAFEKASNQMLFNAVKKIYKILSRYVHSEVPSFQTTQFRLSPKYRIDSYKKWSDNFKEVQDCINTLFSLGFSVEFKARNTNDQKKVLRIIRFEKFKKGLRKSLLLKFKGRI